MSENIKNIKITMLDNFEKQINAIVNDCNEKNIDITEFISMIKRLKRAWKISRIDIKNKGNEDNAITIYNKEIRYESNLHISTPKWYTDDTGIGTKIESENKKIKVNFQCVNAGNVNIVLRGVDFHDKDKNRIPIYIIFKKLIINHKVYLNEYRLIHHNKPFSITRRSRHHERINLEVESETIYDYYPELNSFFDNVKTIEDVKIEQVNFSEYINSAKEETEKENVSSPEVIPEIENGIKISKPVIAMFGSCVSIDPFRSCYNDYQSEFEKKYEHQRSTIISLMSSEIDYSNEELNYLINNHETRVVNSDIRKDFDKAIFKHLDNVDYLIINLVHDIRWGVLEYENKYITNTKYITHTNFYKNNKDKLRPITMFDNEKEFYELWTKSCDKFFSYLSENFPNLKVILQKIELGEYYAALDGTYKFRKDFHQQAVKLNPLFKKLEHYIEDNFEVEIIPFPADTCCDQGNIWGLYSTHYTMTYYQYVYSLIKNICLEDKLKKIINSL